MLKEDVFEIGKRLCRITFSAGPFQVELERNLHVKPRVWSVYVLESNVPHFQPHYTLPDGSKNGGPYPNLDAACQEAKRVLNALDLPLSRKEIVHHFTKAWMRREEESALLFAFRGALLKEDYKQARKLFNKMSGYTKEAIPTRVQYKTGILR